MGDASPSIQRVIDALSNIFETNEEPIGFLKLLYFLSTKKNGLGGSESSSVWKMLKQLVGNASFDHYVGQVLRDAKQYTNEHMEDFQKILGKIENESLLAMDQSLLADPFIALWAMVYPKWRNYVTDSVKQEAYVNTHGWEMVSKSKDGKHRGSTSPIPSDPKYSPYGPVAKTNSFCGMEFTNRRLAKNVIDNGAGIVGAASGIIGGLAVGSLIGQPLIGAVAGGVASGLLCHATTTKFTTKAMNLPEDSALEQAYNTLQLSQDANDVVVKNVYMKLASINDPKKGGNPEFFEQLNKAYELITLDRKEKRMNEA